MIWQSIEDPSARCPANPKRFLFFRWLGYHKLKVIRVTAWQDENRKRYEINQQCEACRARFCLSGVEIPTEETI